MRVKRIVANLKATEPQRSAGDVFYQDVLGLDCQMDQGWIQTYVGADSMPIQISVATEGGAGTPLPDVSIEVDKVDEACARMREAGFEITYGPTDEAWGVRRFYVVDPYGNVVNILQHL